MERLTLETLAEIIESGPPYTEDSLPLMEIRVAQMILIRLLGREVADEICLRDSTERRFEPARRYLRLGTEEDTAKRQVERGARVLWFAEALYNLQGVEGFDRLMDDIKGGSVQAAWEEAAFAMLLIQREVPFRFLHPSKVPGEKTPDLEIMVDGVSILCEVEGKEEDTVATEKSVYNTLEHARKQLPRDAPGLIALKIPELWKGDPAIPIVVSTINRFFHRTERVVAVIVRSENHLPATDDSASSGSGALLILRQNHSSKLLTPAVSAALDRIWIGRGTVGGTPLAALAFLLDMLNTTRRKLLSDAHATQEFREIRTAFLEEMRTSLAQRNPPLKI